VNVTPNPQTYASAKSIAEMLRLGLSQHHTAKGRPWTSADLWRAVRIEPAKPSRVTVWQWCNGKRRIPTDWLLRCADALGWDNLLRLRALDLHASRDGLSGDVRRAALARRPARA
jgi:hypothetical protein